MFNCWCILLGWSCEQWRKPSYRRSSTRIALGILLVNQPMGCSCHVSFLPSLPAFSFSSWPQKSRSLQPHRRQLSRLCQPLRALAIWWDVDEHEWEMRMMKPSEATLWNLLQSCCTSSQLIRLRLKVRALADLAAVSYRRKRGEAPSGQGGDESKGQGVVPRHKLGTQNSIPNSDFWWNAVETKFETCTPWHACVSQYTVVAELLEKHMQMIRGLKMLYFSVVFVEEAAGVNEEMTGISLILSFCSKGQPNAGRTRKHWKTFLSKFSQVTPYLLYIVDYIFREYDHHWSM